MKKTVIALSVMFFVFGVVVTGFCAELSKIGVIDFQKIVQDSSAGKMIKIDLAAKGEEFQNAILAEKKLLDEMKKTFEREALVLSPEKQQDKQREFRIRVNDFKKMQQNFQQQFKQLEIQKLNEIQKQVFEIAKTIGDKAQYALILEKKAAGVVYFPDQLDITDKIIKEYNLKVANTK